MSLVRVQQEDFDTDAVVDDLCAGRADIGSVVTFLGLVRDLNNGQSLKSLTLEHYPGMTEKALKSIADEASQRWDLLDVCLIHRFGELKPADRIVFVAVASIHRHDAFRACEFIMDYLKVCAPFWKKESTSDGEHWVEAKDSDVQALDRWEQD